MLVVQGLLLWCSAWHLLVPRTEAGRPGGEGGEGAEEEEKEAPVSFVTSISLVLGSTSSLSLSRGKLLLGGGVLGWAGSASPSARQSAPPSVCPSSSRAAWNEALAALLAVPHTTTRPFGRGSGEEGGGEERHAQHSLDVAGACDGVEEVACVLRRQQRPRPLLPFLAAACDHLSSGLAAWVAMACAGGCWSKACVWMG